MSRTEPNINNDHQQIANRTKQNQTTNNQTKHKQPKPPPPPPQQQQQQQPRQQQRQTKTTPNTNVSALLVHQDSQGMSTWSYLKVIPGGD